MKTGLFALAAIVPASVGPLPTPTITIKAEVCGGGMVAIRFPGRAPLEAPCHAMGCHAARTRKLFDRAQ